MINLVSTVNTFCFIFPMSCGMFTTRKACKGKSDNKDCFVIVLLENMYVSLFPTVLNDNPERVCKIRKYSLTISTLFKRDKAKDAINMPLYNS